MYELRKQQKQVKGEPQEFPLVLRTSKSVASRMAMPDFAPSMSLHSFVLLKTRSIVKNGVFWDVTPRGSCKNQRF
jgi:hypothetical protein